MDGIVLRATAEGDVGDRRIGIAGIAQADADVFQDLHFDLALQGSVVGGDGQGNGRTGVIHPVVTPLACPFVVEGIHDPGGQGIRPSRAARD